MNKTKQVEILKKEKQVFNKLNKLLNPTIKKYIKDNKNALKSTYLHLNQLSLLSPFKVL